MPFPTGLKLLMDVAEPRVALDRLIASVDGTTWDKTVGTGWFIDPSTQTLMREPLPVKPEWATTFTGAYVRYTKADYTLVTPGSWAENHRRGAGDVYLEGFGAAVGEVVKTTATLPINRAVYISVAVPGIGAEKTVILECGWGTPGASGTVSIRLFSDGNCQVYKGTVCVGAYDMGGVSSLNGAQGGRTAALTGRTVDLMLIPCRRRELLVVPNQGQGFSHCFDDLDASLINTITPSAKFFWKVPAGKPSVQFAPLPFVTAGAAYSEVITFRYAPAIGRTFSAVASVDGDGRTTETLSFPLVKPDLSAWAPDGTLTQVRIKADMAGAADGAAWIYACDCIAGRTATATDGEHAFDLTPYLMSLSLDVPENEAASLSFKAKSPAQMEADGLAKPATVGDRPVALSVPNADGDDTIDVFRGTAAKPPHEALRLDAMEALEWQARDRERQGELYSFRDTRPYDGLLLSDAVTDLVTLPGPDAGDVDVTADSFHLDYSPGVSLGDFQLLPDRGDTPGGFLKKLHSDYAATWVTGWAPTATGYKYRFRDPASFSVTPVLSLYEDRADAQTAGLSPAQTARQGIRTLTEHPENPDLVNQIIVIGYDKRTRRYIFAQYNDAASQSPATVPASRPDNWRGQTVSYQLIDPRIGTQATADRAKTILTERLTKDRSIAELTSDFLIDPATGVPLWKGDCVRIIKSGGDPRGDYRILSLSVEFEYEALELMPVRTATYTALKIGPGTS